MSNVAEVMLKVHWIDLNLSSSIGFNFEAGLIYLGDDIEFKIEDMPLHRLQNLYQSLTNKELI